MLKLLKRRSTLGRVLVWMAICALFLGLWGHLQKNFQRVEESELSISQSAKIILDSIPPAITVFRPKIRAKPGSENWPLTLGQTLGSLVSFAAILILLWTVFKEQIEKLRISIQRKHALVFGFDVNAKRFVKSKSRPDTTSVVVIDIDASQKTRDKVHAAGCFYFAANSDVLLEKTLSACAIKHASKLIISTGNDSKNLAFIKELSETIVAREHIPSEVLLAVDGLQLFTQLEQSDAFMQSLGDNTAVRLFNYHKRAATSLFWRPAFNDNPIARNQKQSVVIVFGHSIQAIEIVAQYLRVSPTYNFKKPEIHWVTSNIDEAFSSLSKTYPVLVDLARAKVGKDPSIGKYPLNWAVDFNFHQVPLNSHMTDERFLREIIKGARKRASNIVVAESEEDANLQIALSIRGSSKRIQSMQAPIYFMSRSKGATDLFLRRFQHDESKPPSYLKKITPTIALEEVVEPFGRSDQICNWVEGDSKREQLAQKLHENYLAKREREETSSDARTHSVQPWAKLSESYKNANRRGADHLNFLTVSRDIIREQFANNSDKFFENDTIEKLARLEHDAWWIERELDGWKYAEVRDNEKKLHPNLVSYSKLSDQIKDYDRAQVKILLGL